GVLHAEKDSAQEHADGRVEAVRRDVLDLAAHAPVAGIVEYAVEPSEAPARLLHRGLHVAFLADVRVHVAGPPAELVREPLAPIILDVGHHHRGPLLDEEPHRGLPDAARSARDQRHLPFETSHTGLRPTRAPGNSPRFRDGATGLRSRARGAEAR